MKTLKGWHVKVELNWESMASMEKPMIDAQIRSLFNETVDVISIDIEEIPADYSGRKEIGNS